MALPWPRGFSSRSAKVIILTTYGIDQYAFSGLNAGASGFLLKDVMPADLVAATRAVAGGDAVIAVILAYESGLTRPGN